MRKFIITFFLGFLLMLVTVAAENIQIKVEPEYLWVGNDLIISCWYSSATTSSTWAYAERTSWNKTLTKFNDTFYQTTYKPPLLGTYQVYCSNGNVNSSKKSFKVSSLSMSLTNYNSTVYLADHIKLRAKITEKNDAEQVVLSDVDFEVLLNDQSIPINLDGTYPFGEEWVIKTEKIPLTGFNPSTYTLTLKAKYRGNTVSDSKNVYLQTALEFDLVDIDKKWVTENDNITFTFRTTYNGNPIDFKKEYLNIWIDSDKVDISSISQVGQYTYVQISTPDLDLGTYDLDVRFSYMSYVKDISETIEYVIPISGSIIGSDNNVINAQLKFTSNKTEMTFVTDSGGSYSGHLPLGTYEIEMKFPSSKLILSEVIINQFEDPIKFDKPSTDIQISGIGVGSIFVYEIALTYSNAYLELNYDDSQVLDESQINIYKCKNWNFGRKICNSDWYTVSADVDTIRNLVKINTTELSAFIIGYRKDIKLDFNTDRDEYYLNDVIRIIGTVVDGENIPIPDAKIIITIPGTSISESTTSDNGGVFTIDFIGPGNEGKHDLYVSVEKPPFSIENMSKEINVIRSEKLTIMLSDSIKLKKGESTSIPVDIVNNGQTDFSNLKISVEGIPESYYTLALTEIAELKASDEVKTSIDFIIPEDASITSYTCHFQLMYDGTTSDKQFILSIVMDETNETTTEEEKPWFTLPKFEMPTGMFTLPEIDTYYLLIAVVAALSFLISIFLKMRKSGGIKLEKKLERDNVKNLLLDIKREIETRPKKKE